MKKILFSALIGLATLTSCGGAGTSGDGQADTLSYMLGMAQGQPDQIAMFLQQVGSDSAHIEDFLKGLREGLEMADDPAQLAYLQGLQAGFQTKKMGFANIERQFFGTDSLRHLSSEQYLLGLSDGINKKTKMMIGGVKVGPEQAAAYMDSVGRILQEVALEKEFATEKKKADDYMASVAKQQGVKPLSDGVYYKVVTEGSGPRVAEKDTVMVRYEGRLIDGKVFDQSKGGEAVPMPVSGEVPGFKAALLAMPIGSKWEVYIPYKQAYGARPMGEVLPAFSNLVFTIELVGKK